MININNEIMLVFLAVIFIWFMFNQFKNKNEGFDDQTVMFVPVGEQRYGLRGEPLRSYDIKENYISANRHLAMHPSGNVMWTSNNAPEEEKITGCNQVQCQNFGVVNDFDNLDTCHQCGQLE